MLAQEVRALEQENEALKVKLEALGKRFEEEKTKPRCCEYCENYIQHYAKLSNGYCPVYAGHCVAGKSVRGRKPDDTCKYFVFGKYVPRR